MAYDVCIVGGGVAGLTASTFTARAGLTTVVVDGGESILRRNAHLENFPGFPAGVDARRLLERTRTQAEGAGVEFRDGRVTAVERAAGGDDVSDGDDAGGDIGDVGDDDGNDDGNDDVGDDGGDEFVVSVEDGEPVRASHVVAASWSDASYLPEAVASETRGSKTFVAVDAEGRTTVDGIYAAGRLADQYHQTVVCAGHGGTVGVTVVHDSDENFYHDWVVPDGYFTDRGREVPPGCEEISAEERRARDERAREANAAYTVALDDEPSQHPSLVDE